ncbi:hypothetical protein ACQSHU_24045, partial [Klebsiella pneumoniae]
MIKTFRFALLACGLVGGTLTAGRDFNQFDFPF